MTQHLTTAEGRKAIAKQGGRQPETAVLQQVRDYLRLRGWFVVRHQQGPLSYKGFPDLTALKDGVTLYVECKTATGTLSQHQKDFRDECRAFGGRYIVARGIDDLEREGL